jgi:hypothetical protein
MGVTTTLQNLENNEENEGELNETNVLRKSHCNFHFTDFTTVTSLEFKLFKFHFRTLTSPLYFIDVIKLKSLYLPGKSSEKITKAFSGLFRTVNTSNDGKITFLQCVTSTSIALRFLFHFLNSKRNFLGEMSM